MFAEPRARRLCERIRTAYVRGGSEGVRELREILDAHPEHAGAAVALAWSLGEHHPQEAAELVLRSFVTNCGDAYVLYLAADLLVNLGYVAEATAYADESERSARDVGAADILDMLLVVRARIAAWSGEIAEAEALYQRVAALDPRDWLMLVPYLEFLKWQGRNADAIALIDALPPDTKNATNLPTIRTDIAGGG